MIRKYKAYKRVHVTTAAPGDLVVMLYDGLIRFTRTAQRAIQAQLYSDAGEAIDKALAIIAHLQDSLREDVSAELVSGLDTTYFAWMRILLRANIERDVELLDELVGQMAELRDAWRDASRTATPALAKGA